MLPIGVLSSPQVTGIPVVLHAADRCPLFSSGYRYAFNVRNDSLTLGLAYDYDSVLHYNAWEFSASGRQTIVPLYVSPTRIGQRWEMSHMDIKKLNEFYKSDCELRTNRLNKLG